MEKNDKVRKQVTIDSDLAKAAESESINLSYTLNEALKRELASSIKGKRLEADKIEFGNMIDAFEVSKGEQYKYLTSNRELNEVLDDLFRVLDQLEQDKLNHFYEDIERFLEFKDSYFNQKLIRLQFIIDIEETNICIQEWINLLVNIQPDDILVKLNLNSFQKENLATALRSYGSIISFMIYEKIETTISKNYTYLLHRLKFFVETLYKI